MEQHRAESGERRTYYLTTAIDYPNAEPHIGHSQEKVAADALARYHRLRGDDVYFSMGLDENSQHVVKAAEVHGISLPQWIARMDQAFRLAWEKLEISYDRWVRTTEESHFYAAREMFLRAQERGDVYKAIYAGWYCPGCNTFYRTEELLDGRCPDHATTALEWIEEENYFFALSRYSEQLLAYIATHPHFISPPTRLTEILSFFHQGLHDFSISRRVDPRRPIWGVPVPGDPDQVIYVWFDALTSYLTAVGFPNDGALFARYWPADVHVIGKDIVRFHCLFWPAMLLSADLPLPTQVAVHGHLTLDGKRMSKSAGHVISPVALVDEFGADTVRYYLLRTMAFDADGDFSRAGLLQRSNDELANDLGNLLHRVMGLLERCCYESIPQPGVLSDLEEDVRRVAEETRREIELALQHWEIARALESAWSLVRRVNRYLEQSAPWRLVQARQERLDTILATAAEALRLLALYLAPFLPTASACMLSQLGLPALQPGDWHTLGTWGAGASQAGRLGERTILFARRTQGAPPACTPGEDTGSKEHAPCQSSRLRK